MIVIVWFMGVFGWIWGKSMFLCNYFDDFNWNNNYFFWYNILVMVYIKNNGMRLLFRLSMLRVLMIMIKFNDVIVNVFMLFIWD